MGAAGDKAAPSIDVTRYLIYLLARTTAAENGPELVASPC